MMIRGNTVKERPRSSLKVTAATAPPYNAIVKGRVQLQGFAREGKKPRIHECLKRMVGHLIGQEVRTNEKGS